MSIKSGRYTAAAGLLLSLLATSAAAASGTGEPLILKPAQSETGRAARRNRAVTEDDYRDLAPSSPGADVHRPQAPLPVSAPEHQHKALNPPAIDDRRYDQLLEETSRRVPAHTPEWTDHNEGDSGTTGLDSEAGQLRFGDGEHGRRPPAGKPNVRQKYRSGAGTQFKPPVRPGPVTVPYPNSGNASSQDSSDDETD